MKKILIPLPRIDFDPTEVSAPWSLLRDKGYDVRFATPDGSPGEADVRMVTGQGLGIFTALLMARKEDIALYRRMRADEAFLHPFKYEKLKPGDFDALLLAGGHAKGMREYLDSGILQKLTAAFFAEGRPVAAICHGVLLAARSRYPRTNRSVLHGRRTTALLRSQELLAWNLTRLRLGDYYRTYPVTVEDEVRSLLAGADDFVTGPSPVLRDSFERPGRGFTVRDGNYLSARWPGDAHKFALELPEFFG